MRKLLIALTILAAVIVPVGVKQVVDAPKAEAATYCAPYVNYWCYQHYLRCGPWIPIYGTDGFLGYTDRCGGWYL
jgi:hypothetical protein